MNKYILPLKFKSELIFNFEGSYYSCDIFDSNNKSLINYNTQQNSVRKSLRKHCVKFNQYCNNNPKQFSKTLRKLKRCITIKDLSDLVKKLDF